MNKIKCFVTKTNVINFFIFLFYHNLKLNHSLQSLILYLFKEISVNFLMGLSTKELGRETYYSLLKDKLGLGGE